MDITLFIGVMKVKNKVKKKVNNKMNNKMNKKMKNTYIYQVQCKI